MIATYLIAEQLLNISETINPELKSQNIGNETESTEAKKYTEGGFKDQREEPDDFYVKHGDESTPFEQAAP